MSNHISEIISYVNKEHAMTKYMNDFIEKIIQKPYTKEYQLLCNAIFCFITNIETSEIVPVNKDNKEKEKIETLEGETIALAKQQTIQDESIALANQPTIQEVEVFANKEKAKAIKTIEDITTQVLNNSPQKGGTIEDTKNNVRKYQKEREELKINKAKGLPTANAPAQVTEQSANVPAATAANVPAATQVIEQSANAPAQVTEQAANGPAANVPANGQAPPAQVTEKVKESERNKQQENISAKIKEIKEKSLETFIKDNAELLEKLESAKKTLETANQIEENIRDIQELKQIQELKEKLEKEETSNVKVVENLKNLKLDELQNLGKNPTLLSVFKGIDPEKLHLSYYIINNYK